MSPQLPGHTEPSGEHEGAAGTQLRVAARLRELTTMLPPLSATDSEQSQDSVLLSLVGCVCPTCPEHVVGWPGAGGLHSVSGAQTPSWSPLRGATLRKEIT